MGFKRRGRGGGGEGRKNRGRFFSCHLCTEYQPIRTYNRTLRQQPADNGDGYDKITILALHYAQSSKTMCSIFLIYLIRYIKKTLNY